MAEPAKVLRWEDPPPARGRTGSTGGHSRFEALAVELRAQPGRWAVVYDGPRKNASGMATHIRMGQVMCFAPCGDFDATTRQVGDNAVVYARYVGDQDGAE